MGRRSKSRFLRKPVEPFVVTAEATVDNVLERMERVSFQGRNLATARRIWRKFAGEEERLIHEIPDNVTTKFQDGVL